MKTVAINGRFLVRRQTGQERFAAETIQKLDEIALPGQYTLIVPYPYSGELHLTNIEMIRYGKVPSHLWEQISFMRYVRRHHMLPLSLCTTHPLLAPGVVCIHDISYKTNPQFFRTVYGRLSAIWHRIHYWFAIKYARIILTDTQCSKQEITAVYPVDPARIVVVPVGWEHILKFDTDDTIFTTLAQLRIGEYFLSIGSMQKNKNMKWILQAAKKSPDKQFVIVGRASKLEYGNVFEKNAPDNIITTGYVSNGELKSLLQHCRALIFPSYYEGFGIPPLEALALGKEAIVSNTSCMPEIYKEAVHYIDPDDPAVDLEQVLATPVHGREQVLAQYQYRNTARIIHDLMNKL